MKLTYAFCRELRAFDGEWLVHKIPLAAMSIMSIVCAGCRSFYCKS